MMMLSPHNNIHQHNTDLYRTWTMRQRILTWTLDTVELNNDYIVIFYPHLKTKLTKFVKFTCVLKAVYLKIKQYTIKISRSRYCMLVNYTVKQGAKKMDCFSWASWSNCVLDQRPFLIASLVSVTKKALHKPNEISSSTGVSDRTSFTTCKIRPME